MLKATSGVKRGVLGGLAGGMVFGMLMGTMGMLPMIGGIVGLDSGAAGFVVHMMMSAAIGAGFGVFKGLRKVPAAQATAAGLSYGGLWWVLGPLTFMPWLMGSGFAANWSMAGVTASMPSLMGHLMYGGVLGFTYFWFGRAQVPAVREVATDAT